MGSSAERPRNSERVIVVSKRLVAVNAASSVATKLLNMTVIFWMYQYLLARIPAEEFAVLPVVMAIIVFAPLFFSFFTGGLARYAVDSYARQDFADITTLVSSIFPLMAGAALVFLGAGLIFALNINQVLNVAPSMIGNAQIMMALLVISFTVQMLVMPFTIGFQIQQRFVELNAWGVARDLLRILLLLGLLLFLGPEVLWVVVATVSAEICFAATVFTRSRQMVPELRFQSTTFAMGRATQLLGFGLWTTLGRLGNLTFTNAATLMLNLFGSAVDVTAYYIGATFYNQLNSTIQLAVQPTQTILTSMHATGDKDRFARLVFRGGRYALWAALIVGVPLAVFSGTFVDLYLGKDYDITARVIVFFMLILPFTCPTIMLAMAAIALARLRGFFLPAFLFQIVGLVGMVGLISLTDMGAVGMALALCLVAATSQVLYFWRLCIRLTDTSTRAFCRKVLVPGTLPGICSLLFCLGILATITIETWPALLLCGAVSAVLYMAVLGVFCLDPSERRDVRVLMGKVFSGKSV